MQGRLMVNGSAGRALSNPVVRVAGVARNYLLDSESLQKLWARQSALLQFIVESWTESQDSTLFPDLESVSPKNVG